MRDNCIVKAISLLTNRHRFIMHHTFALLSCLLLFTMGCGDDNQAILKDTSVYYACEDDIVIEIQNHQSSIYAGIFKGKELLMGKNLPHDSLSSEALFSTEGLSIKIVGDALEVTSSRREISGCHLSEIEMERRGPRDTYYYISDQGALITTRNLSEERIQLTLEVSQNSLLDTILPQVRAASGTKYEKGDIMFWAKQNTAMLVYRGVLYGHCVVMYEDEMAVEQCSDTALHNGVKSFLAHEFSDEIATMSDIDRHYSAEYLDLNGDGEEEIFLGLVGPYFCGTGGCSWYLLNPDFSLLGKFSVSDFPVYISNASTNSYRDLYVKSAARYHRLKFNNGYPANPSVEPVFDIFSHPEYTTGGTVRVLEWAYLRSCQF